VERLAVVFLVWCPLLVATLHAHLEVCSPVADGAARRVVTAVTGDLERDAAGAGPALARFDLAQLDAAAARWRARPDVLGLAVASP
jgi:hypothetical protein